VLSNIRPNQAAWLNLPPWPVTALAHIDGSRLLLCNLIENTHFASRKSLL
jgi:hypothetical protein